MKKSVIIISLFLFSVLAIGLVAAQEMLPANPNAPHNLPATPIALSDITKAFSSLLTGQSLPQGTSIFSSTMAAFAFNEDVTARFLLFLVLTIVLFRAAEMITKSRGLGLTLSAIVSLLAIRFLGVQEIIGLTLPYTALGIVVSILIPFVLFAGLVETSSMPPGIRKLGWILIAGTFTLLWLVRWQAIGDMAWFYLFGTGLCIIGFAADSQIRSIYYNYKAKETERGEITTNTALLQEELAKVIEAEVNPNTSLDLLLDLKKREKDLKVKLREANQKRAK